jgi:thioredoxin-like negative regulator of GroEL
MFERFLIVILLGIVSVAAYSAFRRAQLRRAGRTAQADALLDHFMHGVPAIVYFTTPMCAPCHTQQTPAIERVTAELGERVQVFRVDATEDAEAAERWGVFSVPTTFILDGDGQPREVNYGVADTVKLKRQLHAVGT